jgi:hypothetical protein
VATLDGAPLELGAPVPGGETVTKDLALPGRAQRITVQAADGPADGRFNLGIPAGVERPAPGRSGTAPGRGGRGGGAGSGAGAGGAAGRGSAFDADKAPAKLNVARARVLRRSRRLDVLAPITRLASGSVGVRFRAAGRTLRFSAPVDARRGRLRFRHRVSRRMARMGTGILTLTYAGDDDTRSQVVRLRAAPARARLRMTRPRIADGRVLAAGALTRAARGVVRVQSEYVAGGRTITVRFRAAVRGGRWSLDAPLPVPLRAGLDARSGTVHSYTLFTGYLPRRVRGELRSFQVLGPPR